MFHFSINPQKNFITGIEDRVNNEKSHWIFYLPMKINLYNNIKQKMLELYIKILSEYKKITTIINTNTE